MNVIKLVTGFIPFIIFSVLAATVGVGWASVAGLAVALVVIATSARGGIKIVPVFQAAVMAATAVLAFTSDAEVNSFLVRYAPPIHGILLGLFMLATAGVMPFTIAYARETTSPEVWHSPGFLEVNRRISTAWGCAILSLGLCHFAVAEIPFHHDALALRLALDWVPKVVAIWLATAYTKRAIAAAHERYGDDVRVPRSSRAHTSHDAGQIS